MKKILASIFFILLSVNVFSFSVDDLQVPKNMKISIFAEKITGARSLALGDKNTIFIGSISEGKVYAIVPNKDWSKAEKVFVIADNLKMPNGIAFKNGDLYVAENHQVIRYDNIEQDLSNPPKPVVVRKDLPSKKHHGWRYIKFGPDGRLYISIGAPCNVCEPEKPMFASISRMDADGKHFEVYAKGVRNSVGFDWHPITKELWFTDNGRDWMGDDQPPDELNRVTKAGQHFGFPYMHGKDIIDPKFGTNIPKRTYTPPEVELGPHVAALGMVFYKDNQILIAEHGSWNRSTKIGYRITSVILNPDGSYDYQSWITGWLKKGEIYGRPVDILKLPDGAILISDDYANTIYRLALK